jgi:hypothetical protein
MLATNRTIKSMIDSVTEITGKLKRGKGPPHGLIAGANQRLKKQLF